MDIMTLNIIFLKSNKRSRVTNLQPNWRRTINKSVDKAIKLSKIK